MYAEETLAISIQEKATLAQKSCRSPPPQSCKIKSANGDLEDFTPGGNKLVGGMLSGKEKERGKATQAVNISSVILRKGHDQDAH
eukprot:1152620-Pelagomonas_calceolata.AAC.6